MITISVPGVGSLMFTIDHINRFASDTLTEADVGTPDFCEALADAIFDNGDVDWHDWLTSEGSDEIMAAHTTVGE